MITVPHPWHNRKPKRNSMAITMLFLFFLGTQIFPDSGFAAEAEPAILSPAANATIFARRPLTHLILRQQDSATAQQIRVRSGDLLLSPQGIWQHQGTHYLHFRLPLAPGKNNFELIPSEKKISIRYKPLRSLLNVDLNEKDVYLFHRNDILPQNCTPCHDPSKIKTSAGISGEPQPLCFSCHKTILEKTSWEHSPATNNQCLACHQKSDSPLKVGIPEGKTESICFRCHVNKKSWLTKNHIHGPVGTGDCTVCHNPHGDNNPRQLWADGQAELCVACHTDKKNMIQKDSPIYFIHGILNGAGCTVCHNPHATDNRFQLYKPINQLCTSCHTSLEGVTRGHPVGGHPVEGVKDPRRTERMLACTSCHNPHGSDYKFLLIGDILGGHVCSQCHY